MIEAHEVEYTTFCHATENCDKVVTALKNLIPPDMWNEVELRAQTLHGYYKNPIIVYTAKIRGSRVTVENALKHLASRLSESDKAILSVTLELRYDPKMNKLFMRFSKQDAYLGRLMLSDSDDVIKVVVSFKQGRGLDVLANYLKSLGLIK